jgi:hypothetical protein
MAIVGNVVRWMWRSPYSLKFSGLHFLCLRLFLEIASL